jgi:hypothetical protein
MHPLHLIHAPKIHFSSIKHLPPIGKIHISAPHIPAPHIQAPHINIQAPLINIPKLHIAKPHIAKPISFKEFIGGANSVIKTVTSPTRDLIHGVEHGFSSFGKGIGTVGESLTTPLLIIGGIALVYFVTKK